MSKKIAEVAGTTSAVFRKPIWSIGSMVIVARKRTDGQAFVRLAKKAVHNGGFAAATIDGKKIIAITDSFLRYAESHGAADGDQLRRRTPTLLCPGGKIIRFFAPARLPWGVLDERRCHI